MTSYKLPNGQPLGIGQTFNLNGTSYPSNWVELATPSERAALGITEYTVATRPDDSYYWVTDNGNGTFSTTPKDLEDGDEYIDLQNVPRKVQGLRSQHLEKTKVTTNQLLSVTDWMIIRKVERNVDIPAATVTYRAAVLAECDRLLAAIAAATDVDELAAIVANWPAQL